MKNPTQFSITFLLIMIFCSLSAQNSKQSQVKTETALNSIHWGVNIHDGGTLPQLEANKLAARNLKYVRLNLWGMDPVYLTKFLKVANIMKTSGIDLQVVVNSPFTDGQSRSQDYTADTAEVALTAYNQIKPGIISTKDLVSDYELQNEVPLYPNMNLTGTTGQNASDYDTPAGRLQAAALRGISKAINDVRKQYNLPTRIILGTVDRRFGFLRYMQQQGVIFDIVGYHIYPWFQNLPLDQDTQYGVGGAIGQLAQFNMPVTINEFNSGEIYSGYGVYTSKAQYENQAGAPITEAGYSSIYKHLNVIVNQTTANIESVYFFKALDEPWRAIPENRFGLYYDSTMLKPKISLYLATAYARGLLSLAEQDSLTKRNFIFNFVADTTTTSTTDTTEYFYLIPSAQWLSNSATFGAIFKNGTAEVKVPFTLDSTTGMYRLTIPAGSWPQICMKRYSTDGTGDWGGFATYDAVLLKQINNFISYNRAFNCITIKGWANGTDSSQYALSTYPIYTQEDTTIQSKSISVYGLKNKVIASFEGTTVIELYSITGQLFHKETATGQFKCSVASGIYLLRINGETHKVLVL